MTYRIPLRIVRGLLFLLPPPLLHRQNMSQDRGENNRPEVPPDLNILARTNFIQRIAQPTIASTAGGAEDSGSQIYSAKGATVE